jgi:3-carboxy-cis,cis-muconate cycloisomerase
MAIDQGMDGNVTIGWFDPLFRTQAMRRIFSDSGRLKGMLDFEAALARALAAVGVMSAPLAEIIASQCRDEFFDNRHLSNASAAAGNSAIPVVHELERLVANQSEVAARYVHFGATSQDAMDTGLVLQMREALSLITDDLANLSAALTRLAAEHKETLIAGRTWLQQAAPTTFGLRVVGWLSAVARHQERIDQLGPRCLVLQLGGPVGTLVAYGNQAETIAALVAKNLQLRLPDLPWHAHRDRLAEIALVLGLVVGTLGKIARDIALLSQSEIAEVAEPAAPGRGGSSSMPQKQNPVGCAAILAAAARVPALVSIMLGAMPQEHERGLGGWQAEWETLPEIFELTAGALAQVRHLVTGLKVNADQMQANFDGNGGLMFAEAVSAALTQRIGRRAAHLLVERACRRAIDEKRHLGEVIADDAEIAAVLSAAERKQLFDERRHASASARLVNKALAARALCMSSMQ